MSRHWLGTGRESIAWCYRCDLVAPDVALPMPGNPPKCQDNAADRNDRHTGHQAPSALRSGGFEAVGRADDGLDLHLNKMFKKQLFVCIFARPCGTFVALSLLPPPQRGLKDAVESGRLGVHAILSG